MSGANASPIGRSHQDISGANASPIGRSHQDMSGANASPIGRSHQEMKKIRILIADDHGVVRKGLKLQLEQHNEFEVVGEASDGREAVAMSDELAPDII